MNIYLIILVAYSLLLIAIGALSSARVGQSSDFFVAGRKLGGPFLFATMLAANIGAGSTVGATGLGYSIGVSAWWWVGCAGIGSLVLAFSVGPKIWKIAKDNELYTVGDYLQLRYDKRVRTIGAVFLWLGGLVILSGQLIAIAWILNVVAGISKPVGCLLGAIVVTAYFTVGGLHSTVRVNVLQLTVKLVGFCLALFFVIHKSGGFASIKSIAAVKIDAAAYAAYFGIAGKGASTLLTFLITLAPAFIVSPGLLQKVFGAKDEQSVRMGVSINAVCLLLFAFVPMALGIIGRAYLPTLQNSELALPMVLTRILPLWLGALLLAAIFSAELSAADAIMFMLTTSLGKDLFKGSLKPAATDRQLMTFTRLSAIVCGIIGLFFAIGLGSVIQALSIFYSLITAVFFLPIVGGLYWRRITASAALLSIIVTVAVLIFFEVVSSASNLTTSMPSLLVAIIAGGIVMIAASVLAKSN